MAGLSPIPEPVLGFFAEANSKGTAPPIGDAIPKGQRHRLMVSLAGSMRYRGMGADAIAAALRVENKKCRDEHGQPAPLPDGEVVRIAF